MIKAVISVYDLLGGKVKEVKGVQGINTVCFDAGGIYIVKVGDLSKKITVNF